MVVRAVTEPYVRDGHRLSEDLRSLGITDLGALHALHLSLSDLDDRVRFVPLVREHGW